MSGSKIVKQMLIENKMPIKSIAKKMGIKPQSLSNKINRDSFTVEDMLIIADILNCEVKFVMRSTGKEIIPDIPEYHEEEPDPQ
ncbi:helix-turn-helix domain-containing protein [Acetobacterium wieringae]|uniref:helix-turn-helix domain-containing protein n=1 Tax=Acetobacterium wieringae TaxID=52694 RepID=UPI001D41878D|nr:helix-turn-helix transcriptional regulator [Acetobacterium wieringae]VUZ27427.1 Uncharacterised protein [Acetobacterium wieringae]